jgi:membrane associated rhomboid family serine protease
MVAVMWLVYGLEVYQSRSFSSFGVYPRDWSGLKGIILMPFLHGDFNHIANNSVPFLVLGTFIFYFYKRVAWRVMFYSTIITGIWLWAGGRQSFHIGASGLIYAFAGFVFLSGLLNRNRYMMGLSLLVAFLYGSMIWFVFPIDAKISWEGHLFGGLAGLLLAFLYRKEGPKRKVVLNDNDLEALQARYGEKYWDPEFRAIKEREERERREAVLANQPRIIRYVFRPKNDA